MSQTYWALKRREWAAREQRPARGRRTVPLRGPTPRTPVIPVAEIEETAAEVIEAEEPEESEEVEEAAEPSYRTLQWQAQQRGIKANQPKEDLKKALENAG